MRKSLWIALAGVLTIGALAQQPPVKAPTPAPTTSASTTSSARPSEDTVNAFLQRMYGFDPTIKWKILGIKPTAAPGISQVIYVVGADPRPTQLYITPDGKNAIAGQMIPFGTDPFAADRALLAKGTTGIVKGPADAKTSLVVFSDLECPHCKVAEPTIEKLQQDVPGVKLVYQEFPLAQIHPWSMLAAKYSDCIARNSADKAFSFNDGVFAQQEQITPDSAAEKLNAVAQAQGLDSTKIAACAADPATEKRVQQSIDFGRSLEVDSTPTLFINGRRLVGFNEIPYETLKQLVEYEAKQ